MKKHGGKFIIWALVTGGLLAPLLVFGSMVLGDATNTVELGNNLLGQGFRVTNISGLSVGISTVDSRLTVYGTLADGWNSGIKVLREDGTDFRINAAGKIALFKNFSGSEYQFRNSSDAIEMAIKNNKVGIGTATPDSRLTVYGTLADAWNSGIKVLREDGTDFRINAAGKIALFKNFSGSEFQFRNSSDVVEMAIKGGKVGVGTASPNHTFDIAGTYYSRQYNKGSLSNAVTINWNDGNMQHIALAGNVTLTFMGGQGGARYLLALKQGTGGQTVTWPANVRWSGGLAFTLTTTPNKTDYIGFIYNNMDGTYDAVAFSPDF